MLKLLHSVQRTYRQIHDIQKLTQLELQREIALTNTRIFWHQ